MLGNEISTPNVTATRYFDDVRIYDRVPTTDEMAAILEAYAVSYDANGGTGEMAVTAEGVNAEITLPACTFTAPEGQQFKCWKIGETEYEVGAKYTVTSSTTIIAVWEESTTPSYSLNDYLMAHWDFAGDTNTYLKDKATGVFNTTADDLLVDNSTAVEIKDGVAKLTANGRLRAPDVYAKNEDPTKLSDLDLTGAMTIFFKARIDGAVNAKVQLQRMVNCMTDCSPRQFSLRTLGCNGYKNFYFLHQFREN